MDRMRLIGPGRIKDYLSSRDLRTEAKKILGAGLVGAALAFLAGCAPSPEEIQQQIDQSVAATVQAHENSVLRAELARLQEGNQSRITEAAKEPPAPPVIIVEEESDGGCDAEPVNPDDKAVIINKGVYVFERYNNHINDGEPNEEQAPEHYFTVYNADKQGPTVVKANGQYYGVRAWRCRGGIETAFREAKRVAEEYEASHPDHTTIGPDGQEVQVDQ